MKKIVAVNCSPRAGWNTGMLVRRAAEGAEGAGARVTVFDLYSLERFTGCVSCFGCKLPEHEGTCVCRDGLAPVLEAIRQADGLILGTPNYLGEGSAGFRALYERLIFPAITYQKERPSCRDRQIPVLFIMTSNVAAEHYPGIGYGDLVERYRKSLSGRVGPTKVLISGDTLQVADYSRFNWTIFDPAAKQARRETVFPGELQQAYDLGAQMAGGCWEA